jgi:hypothetical protein
VETAWKWKTELETIGGFVTGTEMNGNGVEVENGAGNN